VNAEPIKRARDCLVGLSVGDAFGEMLFGDPTRVAKWIAKRMLPYPFPWAWTDDTAMAVSIVNVLAAKQMIDEDVLAAAFAESWRREPKRGYGRGAETILQSIARGEPWRVAARDAFGGKGSWGNGAAMRAAPIGAYFAPDLERVVSEAAKSAAPTHAHAEGTAGAVAVAVAAALATRGEVRGMPLIEEVARWTPEGATRKRIERAARLPLDLDVELAGEELGTGLEIAARDTVPYCVWLAARFGADYEGAVWAAASQLGDRDTVAAITGGVVVCAAGVEAIPLLWREATEKLPV
jgi:ADP-ribosylglycohydrolase